MFEPTEKQKTALDYLTDNKTSYVGYGGGAGGGKTYLGCYWLMQMGFYSPQTKYFIGRDSLKDTRESVLHTWRKLSKEIGFNAWDYSDNKITFSNGTIIEFLDLSYYPQKDPNYDRLGSKEYTAGWIEEAAPVNFKAFDILKTRVGRWLNKENNIKSKILCTFNPSKTWVDTNFYQPFKKDKEETHTKFIPALYSDNKHLPEDYIENLKNIKDQATKERLLYGNFDYDDDPASLLSYEDIENLFSNTFVESGEKYIVSDIARFGSDKAVITVWDGLILMYAKEYDKSSTTLIQSTIRSLRDRFKVKLSNIIVDEDGVGGGVKDSLNCKGFVNNSKPYDSAYYNLKSECGYKLAELIGSIYINIDKEDVIKQELSQLKTYQADKDNKLRILPKNIIKDNIGRSPDWLDTLIMRMYFEVMPEIKQNAITNLQQLGI